MEVYEDCAFGLGHVWMDRGDVLQCIGCNKMKIKRDDNMELKKEDFILITALDGKKVYGLRPDYFKEQPVEEVVKEAMEEKKESDLLQRGGLRDDQYQKTNREKARQPKRGKFWCIACDMELVAEYSKCPNCGTRSNTKRLKKETSA